MSMHSEVWRIKPRWSLSAASCVEAKSQLMPSEPVWFTVTERIRLQSGSIHQNQWQWASAHLSTPTITDQINHLFQYGNHTLHQILTHLFLQYLFVGEIVDFHFVERLLNLITVCYALWRQKASFITALMTNRQFTVQFKLHCLWCTSLKSIFVESCVVHKINEFQC